MPSLDQTMERVLALAREAGTPAAAAARDLVAAHLEALGYQVERQRFAFAPSSLNGFPVFGAGLGGLALLLLPLLTGERAPGWAAAPGARGGTAAARGAGHRDRPRLAPAGRRDARGRQPDRHARRRAGAPLDRGPPRHQGADPVDGRTARGGVGHRHGGRRRWRRCRWRASGASCRCRSRAWGPRSRCSPERWRAADGSAAARRERETTGPAWPRRSPRPKGSTIPPSGS